MHYLFKSVLYIGLFFIACGIIGFALETLTFYGGGRNDD